jgi:hypothetical protein
VLAPSFCSLVALSHLFSYSFSTLSLLLPFLYSSHSSQYPTSGTTAALSAMCAPVLCAICQAPRFNPSLRHPFARWLHFRTYLFGCVSTNTLLIPLRSSQYPTSGTTAELIAVRTSMFRATRLCATVQSAILFWMLWFCIYLFDCVLP